jgi:1-acyl-sn-glycerol-3-phosphate acyltransferase
MQPVSRLDIAWRVVATALAFTTFGVGGLLLWLLIFPCIGLFVREPVRRTRVARSVIHQSFRFFIWEMKALGIYTYELHGVEQLKTRRGVFIVANHPTLIDVVFLISLIPQADCVVRSGLMKNPFTRGPIGAANYVTNDSGLALIDSALASLRAGNTLIVFPAGTRTPRTGKAVLQRGAANVAVRGPVDLTPVTIDCRPLMLGKGEPWYKVPERRPHFIIRVHDDMPVQPYIAGAASEPLAARRLTARLETFFEQEVRRGGA